MNYLEFVTESNISQEYDFRETMLSIMDIQSEFISTCMESLQIVMEATDDKVNDKKLGLWERIKKAFEVLFGKFADKVKTLTDNNTKWLKDNLHKIDPAKMDNIKIKANPIWYVSIENIESNMKRAIDKIQALTRSTEQMEKYSTFEDLKKYMSTYVDSDNNITQGFKNLFSTGNVKRRVEQIEVDTKSLLKTQFPHMKQYCLEYDKIVIPKTKSFMKEVEDTFKNIKDDVVSESYSFIEDCVMEHSMISVLPNMIVLEQEGNNDDKPASNTSVTVTSTGSDKAVSGVKNNAKVFQFVNSATQMIKIIQGAVLTLLEERYILFINIFKALVNNTNSNKEESKAKDDNSSNSEEPKENKPAEADDPKPKKKKKGGLFSKLKR